MDAGFPPSQQFNPIRVLLADLPGIYGEVLQTVLSREPDIAVVGQVEGNLDILSASRQNTDIVLLGVTQAATPPGICSHLLNETPALKILTVSMQNNNDGIGYWLNIQRYQAGPLQTNNLPYHIRYLYQLAPTV
jgi:hypothetical protein